LEVLESTYFPKIATRHSARNDVSSQTGCEKNCDLETKNKFLKFKDWEIELYSSIFQFSQSLRSIFQYWNKVVNSVQFFL
jgi:hypothetical protein